MKNLFIVLFLIAATNCYGQGMVISTSWEDGSRNANGQLNLNSSGLACEPDCMQISDSCPRLGSFSQRSIVFLTSPCTCGSSIRCEFKCNQDSAVKSQYYAISTRPSNYYVPVADNKDEVSLQWKFDTDAVPPVSLWERPVGDSTHWYLILQTDTTRPNPTSGQVTVRTIDLGTLIDNAYVDWIFDINWQPNYTGSIKVYKGTVGVPATLYTTIDGANSNAFYTVPAYRPLRGGIYKFPWCNGNPPTPNVGEKVMYYDVLNIGNSDKTINDFIIPAASTQTNYIISNRIKYFKSAN